MKRYRIVKEYPGSFKIGTELFYDTTHGIYRINGVGFLNHLDKSVVENNPEFFKEVKVPLFRTEDGVDICEGDQYYTIFTKESPGIETFRLNGPFTCEDHCDTISYSKDCKFFYIESAAVSALNILVLEEVKKRYPMGTKCHSLFSNSNTIYQVGFNLTHTCLPNAPYYFGSMNNGFRDVLALRAGENLIGFYLFKDGVWAKKVEEINTSESYTSDDMKSFAKYVRNRNSKKRRDIEVHLQNWVKLGKKS